MPAAMRANSDSQAATPRRTRKEPFLGFCGADLTHTGDQPAYHSRVPGDPLNGPTILLVIQPA
jgi:hypothetical protein